MKIEAHLIGTNGEGGEIHKFMDQFHDMFGADHRVILHHLEGVRLMVKLFGKDKEWIMMRHLKDDGYGRDGRCIPLDHCCLNFEYPTNEYQEAKKYADTFYSTLDKGLPSKDD